MTKTELLRRLAQLEQAAEEAHDLLAEVLDFENDDDETTDDNQE